MLKLKHVRYVIVIDNCLMLSFCVFTFSTPLQVLKGVPERPEVALIKLREIKCKIDKKLSVQDCFKNTISVKDVVRVVEGPSKVRYLGTYLSIRFPHSWIL